MRKGLRFQDNVKSCLVLLSFILLSTSSSFAQNYPFPIDDGVWVNRMQTYVFVTPPPFPPNYTVQWIDQYNSSGVDTIINTETYKQFDYTASSNSIYHGAMRYDSGQVYFVPADSLSEYLLYDFTLQVGDTAEVLTQTDGFYPNSGSAPECTMISVLVQSIGSSIVNGTSRKRLEMVSDYGHLTWIDGIGSMSGLFMSSQENISNYEITLVCMSEEDTILVNSGYPFPTGSPGTCSYTVGIDPIEINPSNFHVYPNPTKDFIYIDGPNNLGKLDVVVTDVLGKVMSSFSELTEQSIKLELPEKDGVYLIQLFENGKQVGSERVIKN